MRHVVYSSTSTPQHSEADRHLCPSAIRFQRQSSSSVSESHLKIFARAYNSFITKYMNISGIFYLKQILIELGEAVKNFDADLTRRLAEKAISMGVDPVEALEEGLARALREIGDSFGRGEAFITELVAGAGAMEAGASVLNAEIAKRGASRRAVGRFLIGTVEGDIHSIGKSIVATMLRVAGFEVADLGVDVPANVFVEKIRVLKPDIVGLSAVDDHHHDEAEGGRQGAKGCGASRGSQGHRGWRPSHAGMGG